MEVLTIKQKERIVELNNEQTEVKVIAENMQISTNCVVSVISYYLSQKKILDEQYASRLLYFNNHPNDLKKFPEIILLHDKAKVLFYESGRGRKPVTNKVGLKFSSFLTYNCVYTYEYLLKLIQTFFTASGLYEEARQITIPTIRNSLESVGYHFTPYHNVKISHSSRNHLNCKVMDIENLILLYIGNKTYFVIKKGDKTLLDYLKMVSDFRIKFESNVDNSFLVFYEDNSPFYYSTKESN